MAGVEGRERLVRDVLQILLTSRDEDCWEEVVDIFNKLGKQRRDVNNVTSAEKLERRLRQCSEAFEFEKEKGEVFVRPTTRMSVCSTHFKKHGSCKARDCSDLHFCTFYLLSGRCSFGDGCQFGHSLRTEHNRRALVCHLLGGLDITDLRSLLCLPWVRRDVTVPRVCWHYNQHCGCGRKGDCYFLHLCLHYVQQTCKFSKGCERNHNINNPQVTQALNKYGIKVERPLKEILEEVRLYESGENTSNDRYNDHSDRRRGSQTGARPKRFGSVPNLFQGRGLDTMPQSSGRRQRFPSTTRSDRGEGSYTALTRHPRPSPRFESLCLFHLLGKCRFGESCHHLHSKLPYLWRLTTWSGDSGRDEDLQWSSFDPRHNTMLERLFSQPHISKCTLHQVDGNILNVNFRDFTAVNESTNQLYKVRRLGTPSCGECNRQQLPIATTWLWYWRNQDETWNEIGFEDDVTQHVKLTSEQVERNFLTSPKTPLTSGRFVLDFNKMRLKDLDLGRRFKVRRRPHLNFRNSDAESDDGAFSESSDGEKREEDAEDDIMDDTEDDVIDNDVTHEDVTDDDSASGLPVSAANCLRTVTPGSKEYSKVKVPFCSTLGKAATVVSVERVTSRSLTILYNRKKNAMSTGSIRPDQLTLYYGVDPDDDVTPIVQSGIDCSGERASVNSAPLGKGGHFYVNAAQADRSIGRGKERRILVVRCLVGQFARGSPKFRQPPHLKGATKDGGRYDSCADDTECPKTFVIFDRCQTCPRYLITYRLK